MRNINLIIIHCSATRGNRSFPVEALEACHKARSFRTIGYPRDEVIGHCNLPWVKKDCPCLD